MDAHSAQTKQTRLNNDGDADSNYESYIIHRGQLKHRADMLTVEMFQTLATFRKHLGNIWSTITQHTENLINSVLEMLKSLFEHLVHTIVRHFEYFDLDRCNSE